MWAAETRSKPRSSTNYERFDRDDILVSSAGISPSYDKIINVTDDLFEKTVAVNLKGPISVVCADRLTHD